MSRAGVSRRGVLGAGLASLAAACGRSEPALQGGWVGASFERGHRVRAEPPAWPDSWQQCDVLVVGGGIAGLAAARSLMRRGVQDLRVLELEDQPGGNSRGHSMAGLGCPLGAHYLPLPGPQASEVNELLHDLGLLRMEAGRVVAQERHLCHSPQERLFVDGAWVDGLLPPAARGSATMAQYRRFGALVAEAQRELGFALPTQRAGWRAGHAALDGQTFAAWLGAQGLDDGRLRWYLDYCCRDDYGADASTVSAWAGLHYFASRHGFHAPGDEEGERDPVFTWPEGNAWLARRLAEPLGERVLKARTVLRVRESRAGVELLAWNEADGRAQAWRARRVVLCTPLFVAARLLESPPAALREAVARQPHAPWLVANLQLGEALVDRPGGAPPSWDNVRFGGDARSLGYVDAQHQSLRPDTGTTLITAYWALPAAERASLLAGDWHDWTARVVAELAPLHPDLGAKLRRADLMRHGHGMSIPVPGLRGSPALAALRQRHGLVHFAHADLSAYSVFEEAYTHGWQAGQQAADALLA